jgi:hypothetical protein
LDAESDEAMTTRHHQKPAGTVESFFGAPSAPTREIPEPRPFAEWNATEQTQFENHQRAFKRREADRIRAEVQTAASITPGKLAERLAAADLIEVDDDTSEHVGALRSMASALYLLAGEATDEDEENCLNSPIVPFSLRASYRLRAAGYEHRADALEAELERSR